MHSSHYPVLAELESALAQVVSTVPVSLAGEWRTSRRVTYQSEQQRGSGSGAYVEIEDTRWTGKLECSRPIVCVAFLRTPQTLFWAKSQPPSASLLVDVSVHAYVGYRLDRATFASAIGGARLPSMTIPFTGAAKRDVVIESAGHATGRLAPLVHLDHAEVMFCMIPGSVTKVGRKRIWHLRREVAAALPKTVRDMLAHGRNGHMSPSM